MSRDPRRLPAGLQVAALLAAGLLALPPLALLARVPWSELGPRLAAPELLLALRLSLGTSLAAAALALVLGLPLAAWLAGPASGLRSAVRVLVTLPMVLPPVVAGVALLFALGRAGLVGEPLGLRLPFTALGVTVAQAFVALPFLVLTVEGGLRGLDPGHAEAAAVLGASPWTRLRRVTLPLVAPSVRAGLVVAWARALGEFGATITFAGNLAGKTRTLPLAVYTALETDPEAALVLSLVLVAVSVVVLFALRRQWFPLR